MILPAPEVGPSFPATTVCRPAGQIVKPGREPMPLTPFGTRDHGCGEAARGDMTDWMLLTGAGLIAGTINATAGGGSFLTLPALIAAGVPPIMANASSSVALYPSGLATAWVYRDGLGRVCGIPLRPTFLATLLGGFAGSLLLLLTPSAVFDRVLPWLLLTAFLSIAWGRRLGPLLRARFRAGVGSVLTIQFVLGVYGGYFGGAVGLMMLAAWSLLDEADMKALNPARMLMVTAANTVAIACFIVAGVVQWRGALLVGAGALVGGYLGARVGKRLPGAVVRSSILVFAAAMTIYFFLRAYA